MRSRSSRKELINLGRIPSNQLNPEHFEKQTHLKMEMSCNTLKNKLEKRPSLEDVMNMGYIN